MNIFLHPQQVTDMIKQAEKEDEAITIRCVRKGPASKEGGPAAGDLYDLHCVAKPRYQSKAVTNRQAEDQANGVLTVFCSNRRDKNGSLGAWRRVNIEQVKKVIFKGQEYEVIVR